MPEQLFVMPALLDAEKIDTILQYAKHHTMLKCVVQNYISLQTMLILKQQCLSHPKHILHYSNNCTLIMKHMLFLIGANQKYKLTYFASITQPLYESLNLTTIMNAKMQKFGKN